MTSVATVIQQAPRPGGQVVYLTILDALDPDDPLYKLVEERVAFGYQKYSQYLMTGDGRITDTEIIQELLDAMIYSRKGELETGDPIYRLIFDSAEIWLRALLGRKQAGLPTTEF